MNDVAERLAGLGPQEKRALLAQLLQQRLAERPIIHPLSFGQQALWFLHQLAPEAAAYNVAFTARIMSAVDRAALRRALQAMTDRHPSLRSTFAFEDGRAVQVAHASWKVSLEEIDAAGWSESELKDRVAAAYRCPFDLTAGPVLRTMLFTRRATDYVLLLTAHHIVLDGWSVWILLDELRALYAAEVNGTSSTLPPLPARYADFVQWQAEVLQGDEGERLWAYWRERLAGELPPLSLPTDRPRPLAQTFNGATCEFMLSKELTQAIAALARAERTTTYTILLAAFQVLLHRYTGQDDVIVGSPMAGRSRPEFAGLIGDFINMVVLRANLSGDPPFTAFLAQARRAVLEALEHQDFPFPLLVERLGASRDPSRSPVFQVTFDMQRLHRAGELIRLFAYDSPDVTVDVGGLLMQPYPMPQQEGQLDLSLVMAEISNRLGGSIKYNSDLFDAATIARLAGHFETLLTGMVEAPERQIGLLPLLTPAERRHVLVDWNATRADYPRDARLHELIAAQAARTPDAVAAVVEGECLTYAELDRRANQLAHYLRGLGVGSDVPVGICLERSLEMLVGLLGILKAGGAYVPLDPAYPPERLTLMLEDARAPVLVTQSTLLEQLPAHAARVVRLDADWPAIAAGPAIDPATPGGAGDLAYVIFTSGSTGRPKGVQIEHRSLVNFLTAMRRKPGLTARDRLLAITTLSFDIAALELYLPLLVGATIVIASREVAADGFRLRERLAADGVTVMQATPVTWRMLLEVGWSGQPGFKALCGGEALPPGLARDLLEHGVDLWNLYGPTETTVWSTLARLTGPDDPITVGHPIANTETIILDQHGQVAPVVVTGELFIGGDGVARGYVGRPELTAERFIPHPFTDGPGARLYRTGDLARWRSDGTLEILGRLDHQVKLRGHRIELREIEAVLAQHPAVAQAVVTVHEPRPGDQRLVAYLTAREGPAPTAQQLRQAVAVRLPTYMLPSAFVVLEAIPLTPNGKVDRKALPAPELAQGAAGTDYMEPSTPMERLVAAIWAEALGLERVGVYDSFFDLGGHSLLAVQVLTRQAEQTGVRLKPNVLWGQTLGQVAAMYDREAQNGAASGEATTTGRAQRLLDDIKRRLLGRASTFARGTTSG